MPYGRVGPVDRWLAVLNALFAVRWLRHIGDAPIAGWFVVTH